MFPFSPTRSPITQTTTTIKEERSTTPLPSPPRFPIFTPLPTSGPPHPHPPPEKLAVGDVDPDPHVSDVDSSMDEVVNHVGPSQIALGKRKQLDSQSYTEIECYDGIGALYADDTEDLYAEDDLPTGFIHPYAGNGTANPRGGSDECEDYGEAVFADDESDGEESATSFKGDDTVKGRKSIEYYGGMDHDGDDAMADSGEDIGHEKVSMCSLSPYYWSDFDALVCAPHGFREIRTRVPSTVEGVPGQRGETKPGDDAVPSEPPT